MWPWFGNVILISIYFYSILFLRLLLSFNFDWEDISKSRDSVSSHFQTPRSSSKIFRCMSYFQHSSQCLEMWWDTVTHVWYHILYHLSQGGQEYTIVCDDVVMVHTNFVFNPQASMVPVSNSTIKINGSTSNSTWFGLTNVSEPLAVCTKCLNYYNRLKQTYKHVISDDNNDLVHKEDAICADVAAAVSHFSIN